MNKKIVLFSITCLLLIQVFSNNCLAVHNATSVDTNISSLPEEYLIEDVPYVAQLSGNCFFASLEMIYKYYGIDDIDQVEISVLQGQSYNLAYQPSKQALTERPILRPPYKFSFLSTSASNQGNEDIEFLGDLLGFEIKNYNTGNGNLTPKKSWDDYWNRVKQEISNDNPLITCVDYYVWPPFLEVVDIPSILPFFTRAGHSIVIVGYNEENGTVCINDPYPGEVDLPEKGTYRWINLNIFKRSVRRAFWDAAYANYDLYISKKVAEPLSKDEIFKLCHERNIKKLKGEKSAYDNDFIAPNYNKFGIEAWEQIKTDFQNSFLPFLLFYRVLNKISGMPIAYCNLTYNFEAKCTKEVANYLNETANTLENETLKNICFYESELFFNETNKLRELSNLTDKLGIKMYEGFLIKPYKECKLVIQEICDKIDEIITIKEKIIMGPPGE